MANLRDPLFLAVSTYLAFTGTGMILTKLVLVVGFSTVIFSDMREQRTFALMGVLTVAAALLGDPIFLPAMLLRLASPSEKTPAEAAEFSNRLGS